MKNRTFFAVPGRHGFGLRMTMAAAAAALAVTTGMLAPAAPAWAEAVVEPKPTVTVAPPTPTPAPSPAPAAPASPVSSAAQPEFWLVYSPYLYNWSSSPDSDRAKVFNFSGYGFTGGTISLQRLSGAGIWTTVQTTAVLKEDSASLTYRFPTEATAKFRAVLNKSGKRLFTSVPQTVAYAREETSVQAEESYTNNPFSTADGRVAAGTQWATTYSLYGALSDRRGSLQEYSNGIWRTVQSVSFTKASGWKATVKSPLVSATTSKRYRFTVASTDQETSWTSGSTVIAHMNPADYTGYKKAAYNYMKPYCPKQVITLIDGDVSYAYSESYRIEMARTYGTGKALQYVALHECAHITSFKLYDDYYKLWTRMNAIYGSWPSGIEQLADCMAYAMGADKNYGGTYTRDCSGYRGTAARRVLAGIKP